MVHILQVAAITEAHDLQDHIVAMIRMPAGRSSNMKQTAPGLDEDVPAQQGHSRQC